MKVLFFIANEYTFIMKILRFLLGGILLFSIVFTAFFGAGKIGEGHFFGSAEEYKGIITLWQVDSFEGGAGSRKQFLLKVARDFEKQNKGVLVMVVEHTAESVKTALNEGQSPDMISFGNGTEISGFLELSLGVKFSGGMVGEKECAVPWCRGGYVIIANPNITTKEQLLQNDFDSMLISQAEYTQPVLSLICEGVKVNNLTIKKPMDAYVDFVGGKVRYFLGTQRDIVRLERRGVEVYTRPLTEYNDLYQYVTITSKDQTKKTYSERFLDYLMSQKVQQSLSQISMLSLNYGVEYQNQHLIQMQKVQNKNTISAFTYAQVLKQTQLDCLKVMGGDDNLKIKIKNMLI